MSWIIESLVCAAFLGIYELSIKHAVRENAVFPVLFLCNLCSAAIWLALLGIQAAQPAAMPAGLLVAHITPFQHAQLALKSAIVAASWVATYFAVKHLPVSIASPIRATGPVWTFLAAIAFLSERPSGLEILGVIITLGSFIALSVAGRREGVHFLRNPWVGWMFVGTLLGTVSMLYDRYLLGRAGFTASTVQAWFAIYLAVIFLPLALGWQLRWWTRHEFHWRWSVPVLSVSLLLSDFAYFSALHNPAALLSLVASLRRGSTMIAFIGGIVLYKEHPERWKFIAVGGVLIGIVLTLMG